MLVSALVLGFLGSLHCLGMCGPIAFMLPLDHNNKSKKLAQVSIYHFGRLMAYGVIGILFGLMGKGLSLFGIQQKLSIAIGIIMIVLVAVPGKYFKAGGFSKPIYRMLAKVKSKLGKELNKKTPDALLTIGFLNGFLPCGLVYMALLGAIAYGNALQGGLYMVLFGVGTIPLMTTVVFSKTLFKNRLRASFQKLIPIFVVIVGVLFIVRGLGLGIPYVSPKQVSTNLASSNIECHQP